jgi:D-aminopeptidase
MQVKFATGVKPLSALILLLIVQGTCSPMQAEPDTDRVRARELGIAPGVLPTGEKNDITDVAGVRVGHVTLIEGDDIRTGATAILPHDGNLYQAPSLLPSSSVTDMASWLASPRLPNWVRSKRRSC